MLKLCSVPVTVMPVKLRELLSDTVHIICFQSCLSYFQRFVFNM